MIQTGYKVIESVPHRQLLETSYVFIFSREFITINLIENEEQVSSCCLLRCARDDEFVKNGNMKSNRGETMKVEFYVYILNENENDVRSAVKVDLEGPPIISPKL